MCGATAPHSKVSGDRRFEASTCSVEINLLYRLLHDKSANRKGLPLAPTWELSRFTRIYNCILSGQWITTLPRPFSTAPFRCQRPSSRLVVK